MKLTVVGISHRSAPVALRERVAFTEADIEALNAFNLLRPEQRWQRVASNLLAVLIFVGLWSCRDIDHLIYVPVEFLKIQRAVV